MPDIILHHYPRAPHAEKVRLALGLKDLAYHSVLIPSWMPKPDLMPLTGGYRRTPVMQVGADVFCDTLLILRQLERMHPTPSLFPGGEAMATALGRGVEKSIFDAAVGIIVCLTGHTYPRELVEDRGPFFGFSLAHADMLPKQAQFVNRLNAHLAWLGEILADGRPFLLGNVPSAADLCAYHPLWHVRRSSEETPRLMPTLAPLFPWMDRVAAIGHGRPQDLPGPDALAIAAVAEPAVVPETASQSGLFGLAVGDRISMTPDDTGRDPVVGRLLAVTDHAVVLRRTDERLGEINVHFPRAGFEAAAV
jgi:glutathione S-transferase